LLFVGALLCKTAVCCLPVVLAVLVWWKQGRLTKRDVLMLIPWFAASLVLGLITVRVESRLPETGPASPMLSVAERVVLAGRALWFYTGKVFWPYPLSFVYPQWDMKAATAGQYLFPVTALTVVIALWISRRRIGNGPMAGVLCFVALLVPVLGFFNIYFFRYSYVTDHFQYLACLGLMSVAVGGCARLAERSGPRIRNLGALVGGLVLLVLGVLTWERTYVYRDLETLWRDTLAKNPTAWIAHNNLGNVLRNQGKMQEAMWHYEQVLRFNPDYVESRKNLGFVFSLVGDDRAAIRQYEQVVQLTPNDVEARNNLGNALLRVGELPTAIAQYEQALRIAPDSAEAHYNLGIALQRAGRYREAMAHYEQTLRLQPDSAEAHNNLGIVLKNLGQLPEAVEQYEQAVRLKPDYAEAHCNWGVALAQLGRVPEAMEHWKQALRINPDYAEAHYDLGVACERAGQVAEAVGHYEQALRIKPDYAKARDHLARLQSIP